MFLLNFTCSSLFQLTFQISLFWIMKRATCPQRVPSYSWDDIILSVLSFSSLVRSLAATWWLVCATSLNAVQCDNTSIRHISIYRSEMKIYGFQGRSERFCDPSVGQNVIGCDISECEPAGMNILWRYLLEIFKKLAKNLPEFFSWIGTYGYCTAEKNYRNRQLSVKSGSPSARTFDRY